MGKKNKSKKPANVNASATDVSETAGEALSIPAAAKGRMPEEGTLPDDVTINAEGFARFQADAEAGKLRLPDDEPTAEQIEAFGGQEKWDELKRKVNDVPFETRTIPVSTPSARGISLEQAIGRIQPLVRSASPFITKEQLLDGLDEKGEVVDTAETNFTDAAEVQDVPVVSEPLDRPKPHAVFVSEEMKKLIPDEFGLVPGTLVLIGFNAGQYKLQDITSWLDRSLDWGENESPDFIFYNAASDRSLLRNQRTQAIRDHKVTIAIMACQPHCFMMEPHHIPHTMEADVVLSIDALRVTRDKYRGMFDTADRPFNVSFK